MGRTCVFPKCGTGNKSCKEKLSVFRFPINPVEASKWVKAIPRDFRVTKNVGVCEKHFHETDVVWFFNRKEGDGTVVQVRRERPKLVKGAVPAVFSETLPKYLSWESSARRRCPEEDNKILAPRDEEKLTLIPKVKEESCDPSENDRIIDFADFVDNYDTKCLFDFDVKVYPGFVLFYRVNASSDSVPEIICSLKVFDDLKVQVHFCRACVPLSKLTSILGEKNECKNWRTFESLLSHMDLLEPADLCDLEKENLREAN